MCDFDQLQPTLTPLLQRYEADDKESKTSILIVGCGNAPLSAELYYKGGYKNQINVDYSDVVIKQQRNRWPEIDWRVMNCLDLGFSDDSFDFIIDKSLIDTTMCYKNGNETTMKLYSELHRVLKPGGRLITISLHCEKEVYPFAKSPDYSFLVSTCKILNKRRYDEEEEKDERSLFHTLAVFDKVDGLSKEDARDLCSQHPLNFINAVTESEIQDLLPGLNESNDVGLNKSKNQWDPRRGKFDQASADQLMDSLNAVFDDILVKN
mmetsp:Transcript_29541/g.43576  ORF Transcript_29541/g.43576 Transcript_29541/m.43576 type:complete len:265 (+) Transcript_29541:180-974(+)